MSVIDDTKAKINQSIERANDAARRKFDATANLAKADLDLQTAMKDIDDAHALLKTQLTTPPTT